MKPTSAAGSTQALLSLPSPAELHAMGKSLRDKCPRQSHADWNPPNNRLDPVALVKESDKGRIPQLVPVRHGRMIQTPFTFYRGAALSMAADLANILMLKKTGIAPSSSVSIAVSALILGKAVLIADILPFINRFPNKPLIYNVAWKTVIYWLIAGVIHYLERLYDFWRETGGFVAGNQKLLAEIIRPHFWAIQIILFVLIAAYCMVHELVRVIGREKALRIFFGPMPAPEI